MHIIGGAGRRRGGDGESREKVRIVSIKFVTAYLGAVTIPYSLGRAW